eukprot:1180007-Prymnesium_polylepis.1
MWRAPIELDQRQLLRGVRQQQRGASDKVEDRGRGAKDNDDGDELEHTGIAVGQQPLGRTTNTSLEQVLPYAEDPQAREHALRAGQHDDLGYEACRAVPAVVVHGGHEFLEKSREESGQAAQAADVGDVSFEDEHRILLKKQLAIRPAAREAVEHLERARDWRVRHKQNHGDVHHVGERDKPHQAALLI